MNGIERINEERRRQIEKENWNSDHDDLHSNEELAIAAVWYATPIELRDHINIITGWSDDWFKPGDGSINGRLRELEKAGALIAAEIDRILRVQEYEKIRNLPVFISRVDI
jgi:hypothetical protein